MKWTHIILSRIHDGKLWMQDNVIDIFADLIHEVTSRSKQGSVPIGEKMVKKKVESYSKAMYNGKAMVINTIKQDDVRLLSRIIAYSICVRSKIDELSTKFIYATYKICVEKEQVNLSEILRMQLLEKLEKIKRTKNGVFRFQSLINHIFFHVLKIFPYLLVIDIMSGDRCTMEKITKVCRRHPTNKILDSGNLIMRTFQNEMRQRFRIAPAIVDRFKEDICIMVDIDYTYIQAVEPWETFLDPLGYELNDDIVVSYIDLLLKSEKDKVDYIFGTYDEITQSSHQATSEKESHKKIESIMKKALSEAGMTESESKAARQTMKQGILNIQPLSIFIAEKSSEQSIPYVTMSDVQPSESKRKSKRLVEVVTTKTKRVKQQATRPSKRKKTLLIIVESSDEEEKEKEVKQVEKVTSSKQSVGKSRQPWKLEIEKINSAIAIEGNFVQMNKFYDLYNFFEKDHIDISTMRYIIENNMKLKDIEGLVNQKVYERLVEKKALAREEDLELQKSILRTICNLRTICKTGDEEEIKRLLNNLAPYLRNKVRPFLFMVGEKDKLRSETVAAISQMLTESKETSPPTPRTSEVSVSGDTM